MRFEVFRVPRTASTQDDVRRAVAAGAAPGYCCVADEQTAGRGRQGRRWLAAPGSSLLASALLRVPERAATLLPLAAGVAAADAVRELAGVDVRLRWPNDLIAGGGKLGGILCEVAGPAGTDLDVITGIGLNLRVDKFPAGIPGVSLHVLTARVPARDDLLTMWLDGLGSHAAALRDGPEVTLSAWRRLATGIGERVTVQSGAETITGIAEDIDTDGALLVSSGAGVRRVIAGDVHLLRDA